MTGSDELGAAFGLNDWHPVSGGESGATVYRSPDGAWIAKCAERGDVPDLEAERDRLVWLATQGIPGATLVDWRGGAAGACLVTTRVPGVSADRLSAGQLADAWTNIVLSLRALHDLPARACPFRRDLATMMAIVRDIVGRGVANASYLPSPDRDIPPRRLLERLEGELPRMEAYEAREAVVCHGDCCLPNIMVDPETLAVTGFIDLGRLGVADPYADLALLTETAGDVWNDDRMAIWAEAELARWYDRAIDEDRIRFYRWLDPLTHE